VVCNPGHAEASFVSHLKSVSRKVGACSGTHKFILGRQRKTPRLGCCAPSSIYNARKCTHPRILDHFQHPRNPGQVEDADAAVQIENPACGDILQLTAKTAAGGITEVRFLAKGCVPAMACGSALTERSRKDSGGGTQSAQRRPLEKIGGCRRLHHASYLAMDALPRA